MYTRINRARSCGRKSHEPGPAFIRVGNHLALVCLFLGAALAVFVSGSFEHRIGNSLIFGLMPAIGFYATGHMLNQLLIFGVKFCDMLVVCCSRKVLLVARNLSSWTGDPPPLKWSDLRYVFDIQEDRNGKEAIQA
jgi:hypothetical protein